MKLLWMHPEKIFGVKLNYTKSTMECASALAKVIMIDSGNESELTEDFVKYVRSLYGVSVPLTNYLENPRPVNFQQLVSRWVELIEGVHWSWRKHIHIRFYLMLNTRVSLGSVEFLYTEKLAVALRQIPFRAMISLSPQQVAEFIKKESHSNAMAVPESKTVDPVVFDA